MKKQSIFLLIIILAIAAVVFLFVTENEKKKKAALMAPPSTVPMVPILSGIPSLATQPIQGQPNTYPAVQPIQTTQGNGTGFPMGIGSTGILVKMVQAALGLKIDGNFGPKTAQAVKAAGIDLSTSQKFTDKFISITDKATYDKNFPLKRGSKNNYVKAVQIFLNLKPDGVFGANTEAAILKATGKTELWHADFSAMFNSKTGGSMTYNGVKKDKSIFVKKLDWSKLFTV